MLQLLYPCSRYSPNRCLVCGGSFPDHLELWWSKHSYTPFDRHLDGTYGNALIVNDEADESGTKSRRAGRGKTKAIQVQTAVAPSYAFHRGYVLDISQELKPENESSPSSVTDYALRLEKVKEKIAKEKTWSGGSNVRLLSLFPTIAYAVPDVGGESRKGLALVMRSVRAQVMHAIDSLLDLQEKENQGFKN
jgi:hypothetical protein